MEVHAHVCSACPTRRRAGSVELGGACRVHRRAAGVPGSHAAAAPVRGPVSCTDASEATDGPGAPPPGCHGHVLSSVTSHACPGVKADFTGVFTRGGVRTDVFKGTSAPWSPHCQYCPRPGTPSLPWRARPFWPTETAVTLSGSPRAQRPGSSDGSSQTRSGIQSAAWLWL